MSYFRVIPRDLFNEANLLKCYGMLYIELEKIGKEKILYGGDTEDPFEVVQDESGFTYLRNVYIVGLQFYRPLNSRSPWPLYAVDDGGEEMGVFNSEGNLSREFTEYILENY